MGSYPSLGKRGLWDNPAMPETAEAPEHATHSVFNQSTPLENVNLYEIDLPLKEAVRREGAGWAEGRISALGEICGEPDIQLAGRDANEFPPRLKAFDRFGNRIDEVEFHPAWHQLMALGIEHDLHALPWREPGIGANVARAALFSQLTQVEAGVGCPISMTFSVIPSLRNQPEVAEEWEPRFTSLKYEGKLMPPDQKPGCQGRSVPITRAPPSRPRRTSPNTTTAARSATPMVAPPSAGRLKAAAAPNGSSAKNAQAPRRGPRAISARMAASASKLEATNSMPGLVKRVAPTCTNRAPL